MPSSTALAGAVNEVAGIVTALPEHSSVPVLPGWAASPPRGGHFHPMAMVNIPLGRRYDGCSVASLGTLRSNEQGACAVPAGSGLRCAGPDVGDDQRSLQCSR